MTCAKWGGIGTWQTDAMVPMPEPEARSGDVLAFRLEEDDCGVQVGCVERERERRVCVVHMHAVESRSRAVNMYEREPAQ